MSDEFGIDEWLAEDVTPEQKKDWPAWAPVWHDLIFGECSSRAIHLYAVLARFAGEKGAWPRRRVLADAVGCSLDSLDRAKDELVKAGWMTVTGQVRDSDGGQTSNLYRLHQVPNSAVPRPQKQGGGQPQNRGTKNDNQSRTTKPPTPSDVAAESDQPIRTQPSTPMSKEEREAMDHPADPVKPDKIRELRESFRPGRTEAS